MRPLDALDDFVPVHELAEFFGVGVPNISSNLRGKGCPYYKIGIKVWYRRSQVAEWLTRSARRDTQG